MHISCDAASQIRFPVDLVDKVRERNVTDKEALRKLKSDSSDNWDEVDKVSEDNGHI